MLFENCLYWRLRRFHPTVTFDISEKVSDTLSITIDSQWRSAKSSWKSSESAYMCYLASYPKGTLQSRLLDSNKNSTTYSNYKRLIVVYRFMILSRNCPLSALIACNAMNWPGGDALSFSYRFHHWLMLYTLGQYIVNVQSSTTSDGFSTIFIFGIWHT